MGNPVCPGCGAGYNGKHCRRCGYRPFPEDGRRKHSPAPVIPEKKRRKHPLLGFLILLMLIAALMPLLRSWGLKLEAMEDSASHWATEAPQQHP